MGDPQPPTLAQVSDLSAKPEENHRCIDLLLEDLATLDFELDAAAAYGWLRRTLEERGTPIGPNDMLIAAQALARELVPITDNVAEFERVEGLRVENWRV